LKFIDFEELFLKPSPQCKTTRGLSERIFFAKHGSANLFSQFLFENFSCTSRSSTRFTLSSSSTSLCFASARISYAFSKRVRIQIMLCRFQPFFDFLVINSQKNGSDGALAKRRQSPLCRILIKLSG
jgi:hypothetical protein